MKNKEIRPAKFNNTFYNLYGTLFYFACQWLLTILVVRLGSYRDAGVMSIVISITNIFGVISLYGVRNFQVTDVKGIYSDSDYLIVRLVTVLAAFVLLVLSSFFLNLEPSVQACLYVYIFYKFGETFSDLIFGYFQKYDSYAKIAVSYSLKGLLVLGVFALSLKYTGSLFFTFIAITIVYYAILVLYDMRYLKGKVQPIQKFRGAPLFRACFPLMFYSGLIPMLNFIMRYSVEIRFGTEQLGYFSSVTMVLSVLSTLMNSIFVTIIPAIASQYLKGENKAIAKTLLTITVGLVVLGIVGIAAGAWLGKPVFSVVFGKEIVPYLYLLGPTIAISCALTFNGLLNSVLVSFRKNSLTLISSVLAILLSGLLVLPLLEWCGMSGALYAIACGLGASILFAAVSIGYSLMKNKVQGTSL